MTAWPMVGVRIDAGTHKQLQQAAAETDQTVSEYVRNLIVAAVVVGEGGSNPNGTEANTSQPHHAIKGGPGGF